MAEKDSSNQSVPCIDSEEEDQDVMEKLLKLLSAQKVCHTPSHKRNDYASLCDFSPGGGRQTNLEPTMPFSPVLSQYQYNCSLLQQGSTSTPLAPSKLPPIGIFWDIENCSIPSGKSALAAIQVIRDQFLSSYREAEFIVVCDINKMNSQVVKELTDAQVNLIHVGEQKNAADLKLKQCITRFTDTHSTPAAIILISGDSDFAPDLCDLRYRKKIHVILLHTPHTSKALILCANEHYEFTKLMESLPCRTVEVLPFHDLVITNLPQDQNIKTVKHHLVQLSKRYKGRVVGVQLNTAVMRFTSKDFALRALQDINTRSLFGSKTLVKLQTKEEGSVEKVQETRVNRTDTEGDVETVTNPPNQMYGASASIAGGRTLQIPHYQSSPPVIGTYAGWSNHCTPMSAPPGMIQAPPIFVGRPYSSNGTVAFNRAYNELARVQSPVFWQVSSSQQCHLWEEQFKVEKTKALGKRIHVPQVRDATGNNGDGRTRTPEGLRRARGGQNSYVQTPDWRGSRQSYHSLNTSSNYNGNAHNQVNSFKRRSLSPMCDVQSRERNQWNNQSQQSASIRNARTPSPFDNTSLQVLPQQSSRTSPFQPSDAENEEIEKLFHPINNHNGTNTGSESCTPIELQVTNLDQSINPKKMKHMLASIFLEYVMVLSVSVFTQSDGNFAASVKVPSLPDAQYAISKLHRRKVGYKRILISYAHSGRASPQVVRAQIVMLLQEVPGYKLPLFKFREMYESRFMISISVSELYKMKDVCIVTEDPSGRMVSLNPDHRNTPSPCFNNTSQEEQVELPYCRIHMVKPCSDKGWAEQKVASLPNVKISLKILDPRIHQLLTTHNGSLPLPSLPNCYEAEFKEKLHVDENGVPLEHLVSCLSCVELKQGIGSVKYLVWTGNKSHDNTHEENKCISPPLANQLALFSRELVDLLKTAPHCQLPFNRFIPAYHHHFGRQCRVADYGFTKLIDLLEALTHTVQVMGEGNNRVVTLSHRAQVRRFTSDLLRVLKSKASKQVALSEFPSVYARVIAKPWDIVDYGVCEIEDILGEVSENTVVVTNICGGDKMIAIPKREQTAEEIERTKQFAVEVVELLRHAPQCRMLFNKFVPSYHHHFGHQCRVSDYGFTKLIELFEAIPDVVKIEDDNCGEREIILTEKEGIRVLSEQITKLITCSRGCLPISNISQAFLLEYGYALKPELFGCSSVLQLMQKLNDTVKIVELPTGSAVVTIDKSHLQQLTLQCRRVLMNQSEKKLAVKEFQHLYSQYYSKQCNMDELRQNLSSVVQFSTANDEQFIQLTPLHSFACDVYHILMNHGGSLKLSQFEMAYLATVGSVCRAVQYGFPTIFALLQALPCTVVLKTSRGKRNMIYLNKKLIAAGIALPAKYTASSSYRDTDSSNESFESDSSSRGNVPNNSVTLDERGKSSTQSSKPHNSWSHTEGTPLWPKECDWKPLKSQEPTMNWSLSETSSEPFLKSFIHTPMTQRGFPPPPPKPDSPPEVTVTKGQWLSSVWATPPKFTYPEGVHSTNVQVPPLTLPASWSQIVSCDSTANLLSPTKNLLPAAANPLNPRTSPYFSSKLNLVVAPHPSELPLPSLSLTPKKNIVSETSSFGETVVANLEKAVDSASVENNPKQSAKSGGNSPDISDETERRNTPSKLLFPGKRRLAAQFDQPIES